MIVHVAERKTPVRREGKPHQRRHPVAAKLLGIKILQFKTGGHIRRNPILSVQHEDILRIGGLTVAVSRRILLDGHECNGLESAAPPPLKFDVYVAVCKVRFRPVGKGARQSLYPAAGNVQLHSVPPAKRAPAAEGPEQVALHSGLAVGISHVRVEPRQHIRLLHTERRKIVERIGKRWRRSCNCKT